MASKIKSSLVDNSSAKKKMAVEIYTLIHLLVIMMIC